MRQNPGREPKEEAVVEDGKPEDGQRQDVRSTLGDARSQFYERYHKVAEECDKEFMKKYDEGLSTTPIFVGVQLQPDHNEETTALLRVLIYKMDNTTFGGNVPTVPQWSGPPRVIIQIQVILCASLSAGASSLPAHGTTTTQEGEENSVRRSQKKLPMQSSNNLK